MDLNKISVGVTGHRTLLAEHFPHIKKYVEEILLLIRSESQSIFEKAGKKEIPNFEIVSCLSEGADRLVAEEALALGYHLKGVLPFPLNCPTHARDLVGDAQKESRAALQDFVKKAKEIIEFNPEYVGEDSLELALAEEQRQNAYAVASSRMLLETNILIAIWNGNGLGMPAPAGGTLDTLQHAVRENKFVIWLHSENKNPPIIYKNDTSKEILTDNINLLNAFLVNYFK